METRKDVLIADTSECSEVSKYFAECVATEGEVTEKLTEQMSFGSGLEGISACPILYNLLSEEMRTAEGVEASCALCKAVRVALGVESVEQDETEEEPGKVLVEMKSKMATRTEKSEPVCYVRRLLVAGGLK